MLRLHKITDGPGHLNPCEPCLIEHQNCELDDCERPHVFLLSEEDYAGLVRTGAAQRAKYTSKPDKI